MKINDEIAIKSTKIVGTMWCVYVFILFCILPVVIPKMQNDLLYVSNCAQLCLLPLLMVGQSLLGKKAEDRAEEDHNNILTEFEEMKKMHRELHKLVKKTTLVNPED
jgi:uncharacterized membrane protein